MSFPPQSIKAAQLAKAARRAQSTIRKLVWDGLQLGDRESPGHPRYTLADVAKLLVLDELQRLGIEPLRRIEMVNAISRAIDEAATMISEEIEAKGEYVREGGPWAIIGRLGYAGILSHVTTDPADFAISIAGDGGPLVAFDLRQPILLADSRLTKVKPGQLPEASE